MARCFLRVTSCSAHLVATNRLISSVTKIIAPLYTWADGQLSRAAATHQSLIGHHARRTCSPLRALPEGLWIGCQPVPRLVAGRLHPVEQGSGSAVSVRVGAIGFGLGQRKGTCIGDSQDGYRN